MPAVSKFTVLCTLWVAMFGAYVSSQAEEPYERFLDKLREEQLFDLALQYLDSLEDRRGLGPEFEADLELERGLLLFQSAAILPLSNPSRDAKLDQAEQSLRDFLEQKKGHPRRGEARLKVGELLLQRAEEAKLEAPTSPSQANAEDNPEAIAFYDGAHKLFEETIAELAAILEGMKGARTDPNDKQKVAYRRKIQQDLRQAQLLSAKSVEERGRSRADGSDAQKKDLEQALAMLSDLYSKERSMVGIRNYALFYRSAIQTSLGKTADAIDGFQRVADLEGVDALRPLQTKAVTELVKLLEQEGKFPVAVAQGDKWIAGLRPDERGAIETSQLRLQLARTKIKWAESLKQEDPESRVAARMVRDTRTDLRSLLRVPGSHLEETRQLLVELGAGEGENATGDELPDVKDFAEALLEAQKRLDKADDPSLSEEEVNLAQQQAISLLHEAIRLATPDEDREQLDQAYYSLAYALLKQQELYGSIAVAESLAHRNARSDRGLRAAGLALGGISYVLQTAGEEEKLAITNHLEPFARFLIDTWPDSEEAAAAASGLVQLALLQKQWDKVEQFLALVPAEGTATQKLRRDAGISFYARYEEQRKQAGGEDAETQKLKRLAIDLLRTGTADLKPGDLDAGAIQAQASLARMLLADGQTEEARQILMTGEAAPLTALEQNPQQVSKTIAMNCYRTAMQLVISQLADGTLESDTAISQTSEYIAKLQELAGDADGQKTLAGIFVALASDLKEQLAEVTDPQQRQRLSEALVIVAKEAAAGDAFNTQYWAADTIVSMAEEIASRRDGQQLAQQFYSQALAILKKILATAEAQPGWVQPEALITQIRLQAAICERGLGNYKGAIEQFASILEENNLLLDVQIEAAKTYQAWGDAVNPLFHKVAYLGGRPNAQGENVIWGWGKIGRVVEGKPDYKTQFHDARYNLALSRYKHARGEKDPAQQQLLLQRAERDVTSTATIYPELGGPQQKQKYDALLKAIQKELGKPAVGLAALETISPT